MAFPLQHSSSKRAVLLFWFWPHNDDHQCVCRTLFIMLKPVGKEDHAICGPQANATHIGPQPSSPGRFVSTFVCLYGSLFLTHFWFHWNVHPSIREEKCNPKPQSEYLEIRGEKIIISHFCLRNFLPLLHFARDSTTSTINVKESRSWVQGKENGSTR